MADHGLKLEKLPTVRWRWVPRAPLPLESALPETAVSDETLFRTSQVTKAEEESFRFSFPQLSRQTGDLHFYRLIQILNTPLLCLDSRDLGRSDFAYYRGERPAVAMRGNYIYFWFFADQNDHDLIVAEFGFSGEFTLRSEKKSAAELRGFYEEICHLVNASPE